MATAGTARSGESSTINYLGCQTKHSADGGMAITLYSASPAGDAALAQLRECVRNRMGIQVKEICRGLPGNGMQKLQLLVDKPLL
jgi:hypothetical protein